MKSLRAKNALERTGKRPHTDKQRFDQLLDNAILGVQKFKTARAVKK